MNTISDDQITSFASVYEFICDNLPELIQQHNSIVNSFKYNELLCTPYLPNADVDDEFTYDPWNETINWENRRHIGCGEYETIYGSIPINWFKSDEWVCVLQQECTTFKEVATQTQRDKDRKAVQNSMKLVEHKRRETIESDYEEYANYLTLKSKFGETK